MGFSVMILAVWVQEWAKGNIILTRVGSLLGENDKRFRE